jgi:hypothetical protein
VRLADRSPPPVSGAVGKKGSLSSLSAFAAMAAPARRDTGLLASVVLSTLPSPSVLVSASVVFSCAGVRDDLRRCRPTG